MRLLLLSTILHGIVPADRIELSAPTLPVGTWGKWQDCQPGTIARGFRVKVNFPWMNFFDSQGLTGIELMCGHNSFPNFMNAPSSSIGFEDSQWQGVKMCPEGSFVTGFSLRQDRNDKLIHDSKGATNLKVRCSDGSILEGDGLDEEGNYTSWLNCPQGQGIGGIRTKVDNESFFDGSGLVTVKMACFNIPKFNSNLPTNGDIDTKIRKNMFPFFPHVFSISTSYAGRNIPVPSNSATNNKTNYPVNETKITVVPKSDETSRNVTNNTIQNGVSLETEKKIESEKRELEIKNIPSLGINDDEESNTKKKIEPETKNKETSDTEKKELNDIKSEPNAETSKTQDNLALKTVAKNNTSVIESISSYKDPYFNFPIALEVLILIGAAIFFFVAGFLFKKIYLVKFQEKRLQKSKDNKKSEVIPVQFTDVKVSK